MGEPDLALKVLYAYMDSRDRLRAYNSLMSNMFRGPARQTATVSELAMLEISLLLKDNDAVMKILNYEDGNLKTSSCSLALLIQYQDNSLLKSFVRDNIEKIRLDSRGLYDPQMEDKINESLSYIPRNDWQYYIKALLYAHRNVQKPWQENLTTAKQERMKKLAQEFSEIPFQSDNLKKQALLLLIQDLSSLPYISKAINERAKNIELTSISSIPPPNINTLESPDFQLYLADKMSMLMDGDPNGFLNMLTNSKSIYDPNLDLRDSFSSALITGYVRLITGTDWKAEKLNVFLAVSDELLSSLNYGYFSSNILQLVCCRAALLLLADESSNIGQNTLQEIESTFALIKRFQENFRGLQNSSMIRNNDVLAAHQVLARYMNSMNMTFEKRLEILKKLYSLEQIADAMNQQGSNSMLSLVTSEKIFSVEEVIARADALMTLSVVKDTSWQTLAFYQERQGLLDDAEKSWRKAVEMSIKSDKPWTNMQRYIFFLNRNNLFDKAVENWRSFDTTSLSQKSIGEYNTLIQRLENKN